MVKRRFGLNVALAVGTIVSATAVVALPNGDTRELLGFLVLAGWPTIAWFLYLDGPAFERFVIAASLSLLLNTLVVLGIVYMPGPPPSWALLLAAAFVALLPLLLVSIRRPAPGSLQMKATSAWAPVLMVALLAIFLRLGNVGYKELQGDEGIIMVRAAAVLTGGEGQLFLHQKGPAEILLPLQLWGVTGTIDDLWARMPFSWAGLLGVAVVGWLGTIWFGRQAGLVAALLLAINGLAIAFSRIVQYQTLVVLWGGSGLVAAWRYRQSGRPGWLWLASTLLAGSLLAHYDALLFFPAAAWMAIGHDLDRRRFAWRAWVPAMLLGGAIVALFYLPYALDPTFSQTVGYLINDRLGAGAGGSPIGIAVAAVWRMITFYNSLWYVLGLALLVLVGLWQTAAKRLTFAVVLLFAVPTLFYGFLVVDPRTHVYTLFPGAVILAGFGLSSIWNWAQQSEYSAWRIPVAIVGLLWLATAVLYVYLMFVDTTPERQRTWDENRPLPALYPTTWLEPPRYGLFGFPYQAGWRTTPQLMAADSYPYGSNEEKEVTNWYMAQAPRTQCENMGAFILGSAVQDEVPYDSDWVNELHLQYQLTVNGEVKSEIYGREPVQRVESFESTGSRRWLAPDQVAPPEANPSANLNIDLEDQVKLLGYDIDDSRAIPGGQVLITLYWEALRPLQRNYQVFVHLYDGQMRAQDDSAPECDINPTSGWQQGQIVVDPHVVQLPVDLPPGPIPVLAGMYDLITQERLTSPEAPDGAVLLTQVDIRPE